MARATNKLSEGVKAMTTGLRVVGGANVPAYSLEFLTDSKHHPVNSSQTIIVPYVELGRSPECIIKFEDSLTMVSKKHAAIERREEGVFLKQLSKTNQTLLNGRPVIEEWMLTNGDEIQLSASGPRMRYLISVSKTSDLGVSRRIQLFAQQSLKPYKTAIFGLVFLLLLLTVGGVLLVRNLKSENRKLFSAYSDINEQAKKQQEALSKGDASFLAYQKVTAEKLAESNRQKEKLDKELGNLRSIVKDLKTTKVSPINSMKPLTPTGTVLPKLIEEAKKHVYFIKMYLTVKGVTEGELVGTGTGFMLDDGRFVTTRHSVQPWAFTELEDAEGSDNKWLVINWLYNNRPKGTINLTLEVISPENNKIYLSSEKFIINDDKDFYYNKIDVGYGPGKIQLSSSNNGLDWAFFVVDEKSMKGLRADPLAANTLKTGTVVHILGYAYSLKEGKKEPIPYYSTANVSQNGLIKGVINVTNLGFAEGNSGGPVFVQKDDQFVSIGLVSAGKGALGTIVPISAIKR